MWASWLRNSGITQKPRSSSEEAIVLKLVMSMPFYMFFRLSAYPLKGERSRTRRLGLRFLFAVP